MIVLKSSLKRVWRAVLVAGACFLLQACTKPISIAKPFEASRAGQVVSAQFTVRRSGKYSFSLMFVKAPVMQKIHEQEKVWGNPYRNGVEIEINLRVLRDGVLMLDQDVRTGGTSWQQSFCWRDQNLGTSVRVVRILKLPPGDYVVEMRTLLDTPQFKDIKTFADFSYYNPKV